MPMTNTHTHAHTHTHARTHERTHARTHTHTHTHTCTHTLILIFNVICCVRIVLFVVGVLLCRLCFIVSAICHGVLVLCTLGPHVYIVMYVAQTVLYCSRQTAQLVVIIMYELFDIIILLALYCTLYVLS